jgi:hypothetical protein
MFRRDNDELLLTVIVIVSGFAFAKLEERRDRVRRQVAEVTEEAEDRDKHEVVERGQQRFQQKIRERMQKAFD